MHIGFGPQALQLIGLGFEGWHGYLFADVDCWQGRRDGLDELCIEYPA
jgi:hypothetical protein